MALRVVLLVILSWVAIYEWMDKQMFHSIFLSSVVRGSPHELDHGKL